MATFGLGSTTSNQAFISRQKVEANTPWMAASEGNLALLQHALTTLSMPITVADENGYTLLHAAASYDQIEIIRFLLGNSVNIHATDNDGDSALHYAGKAQTAQILIEVGKANPNQVNQEGKTPLDAKQEEMNEMMEDEDIEDDDEDLENVKGIVLYLSKLC